MRAPSLLDRRRSARSAPAATSRWFPELQGLEKLERRAPRRQADHLGPARRRGADHRRAERPGRRTRRIDRAALRRDLHGRHRVHRRSARARRNRRGRRRHRDLAARARPRARQGVPADGRQGRRGDGRAHRPGQPRGARRGADGRERAPSPTASRRARRSLSATPSSPSTSGSRASRTSRSTSRPRWRSSPSRAKTTRKRSRRSARSASRCSRGADGARHEPAPMARCENADPSDAGAGAAHGSMAPNAPPRAIATHRRPRRGWPGSARGAARRAATAPIYRPSRRRARAWHRAASRRP